MSAAAVSPDHQARLDAAAAALASALAYQRGGWSVIPIRGDGTKAPALKSWEPYTARIATEAEVRDWFAPGRVVGPAVINGAVSGDSETFDFDEDAAEVFPAWCDLVEDE